MGKQYFSKAYNEFFTELALNNEKKWFDEHKAVYLKEIKAPFEAFVRDLVKEVQKFEPDFEISPKDAIFRIYRDLRFSKDKTPYKTHMSAAVTRDKSAWGVPGYFVGIGAQGIALGGGLHELDKEALAKIRKALIDDPKTLQKRLSDPAFESAYGGLRGEQSKNLPAEFKPHVDSIPLLANKQFYFWKEIPDFDLIISDHLLEDVVGYFKIAKPINHWLRKAVDK